jgi:flagellar basal-body rod protein FlgB
VRVDDIPLFSMLKGRLGYLNQRQKLIAQNVANADVAGYTPKDLKAQSFSQQLQGVQAGGGVTLAMTQPGHMSGAGGFSIDGGGGSGGTGDSQAVSSPDSETRMNGNSVVLEEEMLKMAESRMAYDAAISFYQQSLNMLRLAARKPNG